MSKIADIIQNNNWRTSSFERSTDVNRLFNSGILTMMGQQANDAVSAIDQSNVQSVITLGLSDFGFKEQNLGSSIIATKATSIAADFKEYQVKTFYGNQWWQVTNIERDLMQINKPLQHVNEKIGAYWAIQINKLIGATVSSLTRITEITTGDGTKNLSLQMVLDSRNLKAELGYGDLGRMYMSSGTLFDILTKINDGRIPFPLITEAHGDLSISLTNPVGNPSSPIYQTTAQQTRTAPMYVFNGVTPIVLDDSIANGTISIVENNAFGYARKDLTSPLMYANDPKSGNGAGSEEWGTKSLYVVHPLGFGFIGKQGAVPGTGGVTYVSRSGLTIAELLAYKQYALVEDVKLSKIMNLNVKIG